MLIKDENSTIIKNNKILLIFKKQLKFFFFYHVLFITLVCLEQAVDWAAEWTGFVVFSLRF